MSMVKLLRREKARAVIHFTGATSRPPVCGSHWYQAATIEKYGDHLVSLQTEYPDDILFTGQLIRMYEAPDDDPTYRWAFGNRVAPAGASMEEAAIIRDWSELDQFLAEFPDPNYHGWADSLRAARAARPNGYILACWHLYFNGLLEYLRGIQNLCLDFYDARDEIRRIDDRLLAFFRIKARVTAESGADGVWGGEDVAGQESPIMRPETFREVYAPYYQELGEILHENDLDYWWHSDGILTPILDDLVGFGVDVVHPLQADCHDDTHIASEYGGKIAFWAGMDVQHILPFGTPNEVRAHVHARRRNMGRPDGGLIVGAGNTIGPEVPLENLRAYHQALRDPLDNSG